MMNNIMSNLLFHSNMATGHHAIYFFYFLVYSSQIDILCNRIIQARDSSKTSVWIEKKNTSTSSVRHTAYS